MGAIAVFNYPQWVAMYPEFSEVTLPAAQGYFAQACVYHRNDGAGPVQDATVQLALLNMLTAHVAARYAKVNGQPASTIVGRISNASEGSVSVQTENDYPAGSAQWYQQTKYGSDYWNATRAYRTARYLARPTVVVNGVYPSGVGPFGPGFVP